MNRGTAGVFEEYGSVIASVVGMAVAMAAILTLEDRPGLGSAADTSGNDCGSCNPRRRLTTTARPAASRQRSGNRQPPPRHSPAGQAGGLLALQRMRLACTLTVAVLPGAIVTFVANGTSGASQNSGTSPVNAMTKYVPGQMGME